MNVEKIKKIANERGIRVGKLKKTDIVRQIQSAEGNNACYDIGQSGMCGQDTCLWRDDCK